MERESSARAMCLNIFRFDSSSLRVAQESIRLISVIVLSELSLDRVFNEFVYIVFISCNV